jgi:hypothetical protein
MRTLRSIHHSAPAMPLPGAAFAVASQRGGSQSTPNAAQLALRLKVLVTRVKLDHTIEAGGPCEASEELALRTHQLTEPRVQRQIAANLRRLIDYVDRREARAGISAVVIEPRAVRDGRDEILSLAESLELGAPVSPRGILFARRLLTDGLSPLFNPGCRRTVREAVKEVREALEELPASGL